MASRSGGRMAIYIEGHAESLVASTEESEAALGKLQTKADETNASLGKTSSGFASYTTATSKSKTATDGHAEATERHGKATDALGSSLKAAAGAFAPMAVLFGGYEVIKKSAEYTEELAHNTEILTQATGLGSKEASQFLELGKQWGVSNTQVGTTFKTLSKQIKGAEEGSTSSKKAFHDLNIPLDELRKMKPEEVLKRVSDAFEKMPAGAQKTALNTQLFGRSALNLLPILDEGSKGLDKQLGKFEGLSKGQLESAKSAMESERDISRAYDQIQVKIAFAMLSAGKSVSGWITDIKEGKGQVAQTIGDIAHILGPILKSDLKTAEEVFRNFGQIIKGVCEVISGVIHLEFTKVWKGVKDIFSGGVKQVIAIVKSIGRLLSPVLAPIGKEMASVFGGAWETVEGIFESGRNAVVGFVEDIAEVINLIPGVPDIHIGNVGASHVTTGNTEGSTPGNEGNLGKTHVRKARGGPIDMGEPQGDTVPAMLERGEYVLNRKAVAAIGKESLDHLNFVQAPRLSLGSAIGSAADFVSGLPGKALGTAVGAIGALPTPHLPGWLSGLGSYALEHVAAWIKSGFSSGGLGAKPSVGGGSFSGKTPAGVGSFGGFPVDNWIIPELEYARAHGWTGPITSGYRTPAHSAELGHPGDEHTLTSYPGGAVDFGGEQDPAGAANRAAFIAATKGYTGPRLLLPEGFRDDGHMSGDGHASGGLMLASGGAISTKAIKEKGWDWIMRGQFTKPRPGFKNPHSSREEHAMGGIAGYKNGGSVGSIKSTGVLSPEEWAMAMLTAGFPAKPGVIAQGLGTIKSESGFNASSQVPGNEHIGGWAESSAFGSEAERLNPIASSRAALKNYNETGSFWQAWGQWEQEQSGLGGGGAHAYGSEYLSLAEGVIKKWNGGSASGSVAATASAAKKAVIGLGRGIVAEIPGLSRSRVGAAGSKLPGQFQSQLRAPGITLSEKLSVGHEALAVAEESDNEQGEINAASYVLEIEERNRLRIQKKLRSVLLKLLKPQSPRGRKKLIAEAQHLRAELGQASSEIRSAHSTIKGVHQGAREAAAEKAENETPAEKAHETGWGGQIDEEGHLFEGGEVGSFQFPGLEAELQQVIAAQEETQQQANEHLQEIVGLLEERNAELQKTNATIESNSSSIIQSLIAVVNGGIGGKVGLGFQTHSVAGSLASY